MSDSPIHSDCSYEKRFANIESDIAELRARMDSKKDDIFNLNKELLRDHQQQGRVRISDRTQARREQLPSRRRPAILGPVHLLQ